MESDDTAVCQPRQKKTSSAPPASPNRDVEDALDAAMIAELPYHVVTAMTNGELIRVITASATRLPRDISLVLLPLKDRDCLLRLAFLARHACRSCKRAE